MTMYLFVDPGVVKPDLTTCIRPTWADPSPRLTSTSVTLRARDGTKTFLDRLFRRCKQESH